MLFLSLTTSQIFIVGDIYETTHGSKRVWDTVRGSGDLTVGEGLMSINNIHALGIKPELTCKYGGSCR